MAAPPPAGIKDAPPPWQLEAESWLFPLAPLSSASSFPKGFAAEYQAEALSSGGEFIGGSSGMAWLVRYSESLVGPYDELIYFPGRWKFKDGRKGFRATRIYVSTKDSVFNGRRNWNIPKQLASFTYTASTSNPGTYNFTVSLPSSSTPFFRASFFPIPLVSALKIPFSLSFLGSYLQLIHPPLPSNPSEKEEEVGTLERGYSVLTPTFSGKLSLGTCRGEMDLDGKEGLLGDGESYPALKPLGLALMMEKGTVFGFGESEFVNF